jgi:hypothetical protein
VTEPVLAVSSGKVTSLARARRRQSQIIDARQPWSRGLTWKCAEGKPHDDTPHIYSVPPSPQPAIARVRASHGWDNLGEDVVGIRPEPLFTANRVLRVTQGRRAPTVGPLDLSHIIYWTDRLMPAISP